MLGGAWEDLSTEDQVFVNDLVRYSYMHIIKIEKIPRCIEEGLLKLVSDAKVVTNLGKMILTHHYCSPKCLVRRDQNEYVCRKPNYLLMNPPPNNTRDIYKELYHDISLESLYQLEKVRIIDPL